MQKNLTLEKVSLYTVQQYRSTYSKVTYRLYTGFNSDDEEHVLANTTNITLFTPSFYAILLGYGKEVSMVQHIYFSDSGQDINTASCRAEAEVEGKNADEVRSGDRRRLMHRIGRRRCQKSSKNWRNKRMRNKRKTMRSDRIIRWLYYKLNLYLKTLNAIS